MSKRRSKRHHNNSLRRDTVTYNTVSRHASNLTTSHINVCNSNHINTRVVGHRCILCSIHDSNVRIGGWNVCRECSEKYIWNSKGRYFRLREYNNKYSTQYILTVTVARALGVQNRNVCSEICFPDWCMSSLGGTYKYDIGVPSKRLLIEYHGEQHYLFPSSLIQDISEYIHQRDRDAIKQDIALKNGWNYVVVSYLEDAGNIEWIKTRIGQFAVRRK